MPALLLLLILASQPGPPIHTEQVRLLAADLRVAADLVHLQALQSDPDAPATDKLDVLARRARRFEVMVPAFEAEPAQLVEDFRDLKQVYDEARVQIDRSAGPEVALSFQWIEMLMAKIAMLFGDYSISQAEFTPGAAIPRGETHYTEEGLEGLADEVYILSNQVTIRSSAGSEAFDAWASLAEKARMLQEGLHRRPQASDLDRRFAEVETAWLAALPRFFSLHPDQRSQENYSLLLSNYVRLRAAWAQLHPH